MCISCIYTYHCTVLPMMKLCVLCTAGEITAVIVGVVLIITGLLVILAIVFTLKLRNDRHHVIYSSKSELR